MPSMMWCCLTSFSVGEEDPLYSCAGGSRLQVTTRVDASTADTIMILRESGMREIVSRSFRFGRECTRRVPGSLAA